MNYWVIAPLALLMSISTQATDVFQLSEITLSELLSDKNPTLLNIDSAFLMIQHQESSLQDRYQLSLAASTSQAVNNERSLVPQEVIATPIQSHTLGFTRPTQHGVDLTASIFSKQASSSYLADATTSGVGIGMTIDLHKNFWGRLTQAELGNLNYALQKTSSENKIKKQAFYNELRKIYWSLVANNEAQKISHELLNSSMKQFKDAQIRYRNSVADLGEVSKYESQVASRKVSIITLEYQKEQLLKSLKELLPDLAGKEIVLAAYDLDKALGDVLSCTEFIRSTEKAPMQYTYYDEVVEAAELEYFEGQKVNDSYADWDLKFSSEYKRVGKDLGYSESFDDFQTNGKGAYQVGLTLSIPLGSKKKSTQQVKRIYNNNIYVAKQREILAKVKAEHQQLKKSVELMYLIMKNQKINSQKLHTALEVSHRKYRQARISANEYIFDQDSFLASNLDELKTKLLIISTVIDYLSVFSETPCTLNRTKI